MKKIILLMFTVFLNVVSFSCSPEAIEGNDLKISEEKQRCCGDGSTIPPPPPSF